jgi:hypothetical protein
MAVLSSRQTLTTVNNVVIKKKPTQIMSKAQMQLLMTPHGIKMGFGTNKG